MNYKAIPTASCGFAALIDELSGLPEYPSIPPLVEPKAICYK